MGMTGDGGYAKEWKNKVMEGPRAWVRYGAALRIIARSTLQYYLTTVIIIMENNNNKAWDAEATCFSCCLGPKISCILHCLTQVEGPPPPLSTSSCYIVYSFFSQKYRCI